MNKSKLISWIGVVGSGAGMAAAISASSWLGVGGCAVLCGINLANALPSKRKGGQR